MRRGADRRWDTSEPGLQAYLLGTVDFAAALRLQRRLHFDVSGDRSQAALIVCEHPPLITVGRGGSRAHIRFDPQELQARRWAVRWVNRGGGCLLHVPGQLAIYPILPLDRLGLNVPDYLTRLGEVQRDVLDDFSVRSEVRLAAGGVWTGNRQVAALGVAVRDWVSYFGAYLNVQPCLDPFRLITCTAASQEPMTSLERERHGPVRAALVRQRLLDHFSVRFGFSRTALFTSHPMLQGLSELRANPHAGTIGAS
jgi:lipoyl(octanoyl) transferase